MQSLFVLVAAALVGSALADHNCLAEPTYCLNGGICHSTNSPFSDPQCICPHPYAGKACEYRIRECTDNPCMNKGQCVPASCQPTLNPNNYESVQFDCFRCVCPAGWGGSPFFTNGVFGDTNQIWNAGGICDYPKPHNDCGSGQKCFNGGNCTSLDFPWKNTFSCACPPEYVGGDGHNCTEVIFNCDPSAPFREDCKNGGTCPGVRMPCTGCGNYGGARCDQPLWCETHSCLNGGSCMNSAASTGSCTCPTGFGGTLCEQPTFCSVNTCQNGGTCVDDGQPAFTGHCDCTSAFSGRTCNATAFCMSSPCQNGATCVNDVTLRGGEGHCINCPRENYGDFCEKTIGGCAVTGCSNGGSCLCTNSNSNCQANNFESKCNCKNNGATGLLTYVGCNCNQTLTLQCPPTQTSAPSEYTSQPTQVPGSDVDFVCRNGASCYEWAAVGDADSGGRGCKCLPGFWGDQCQNYDNPCLNYPCENDGRCTMIGDTGSLTNLDTGVKAVTDRYWGYMCNCKYPYYGSNCELRWNSAATTEEICANNRCQNGATCIKREYSPSGGFFDTNLAGVTISTDAYACVCPSGFRSTYCDIPVETCTPGICQNGGFCQQNSNTVRCFCPCGFAGDKCEIAARNFAASAYGNTQLDFCTDSDHCKNGATCLNALNGQDFMCACRPGWAGRYCTLFAHSGASGVAPSALLVAAAIAVATALFVERQ